MTQKKKLGIIGGMGSRAGVLLLRKVIDYSPAEKDQDFPEIIFHNNANTPDRTRAIVYNEPSPVNDLLRSVQLFNENGVEVAALACITSYYYYNELKACADGEILNPLQLVADTVIHEMPQIRKVGLLATTGTMRTGLFHSTFKHTDVELVTLDPVAQEALFMEAVYGQQGLKSGIISPRAGILLRQSVEQLMEQGAQLIIGGCTEVSVGWDPGQTTIPFIDVLDLLARKMVQRCYSTPLQTPERISNGQESNTYRI